ncbi:hypothetical protein GCM10027089_26260 [Nocardia thraciensis]
MTRMGSPDDQSWGRAGMTGMLGVRRVDGSWVAQDDGNPEQGVLDGDSRPVSGNEGADRPVPRV